MKEELALEVIQHAIKYAESQNSKLQDIRADAAKIQIDAALQIDALQKMADANASTTITDANISIDATTEGEQEQQDDPE